MYELMHQGFRKYGDQWAHQYALHFFMYYHAGQAAAMAKAHTELDFWNMQNYGYQGFKRGTERRHFRGEKGKTAMLTFQRMGSPREVWERMYPDECSFTALTNKVKSDFAGCQIGPYFVWKAMDIMDRCLGMPIAISLKEALWGMPDEPRQAAAYFWPEKSLSDVLQMVVEEIADNKAPGNPDRNCGYAEAETILCMMKGYFKTKTHRIGDDVDEKHAQLKEAGHDYLCDLLPPKLDWSTYEQAMGAEELSRVSS